MPSHALRASSPSRMSPATALRTRAHRERPRPGRARTTSTTPSTATTAAIATSGMDDRTGDGSTSSTTTVRTACTTCPAERSHATARRPRPTSLHVATVADPAVDVADDAAGQRDVEEQRPVVRAPPQRRSGRSTPRPRATIFHRQAQHTVVSSREARGRRQRPAVDRADAVEERAGAEPPDQDGEGRGRRQRGGPTPTRSGSSRRPSCSGQDQQVGVVAR